MSYQPSSLVMGRVHVLTSPPRLVARQLFLPLVQFVHLGGVVPFPLRLEVRLPGILVGAPW